MASSKLILNSFHFEQDTEDTRGIQKHFSVQVEVPVIFRCPLKLLKLNNAGILGGRGFGDKVG